VKNLIFTLFLLAIDLIIRLSELLAFIQQKIRFQTSQGGRQIDALFHLKLNLTIKKATRKPPY